MIKYLTEKENSLQDYFDEIDKKYDLTNKSTTFDDELNLEKLDDVNLQEDEIAKLAKDSLSEYYNTNVNDINTQSIEKEKSLNKEIASEKTSSDSLKNTINETIDSVKEDASNSALKRGLARSSIIINQLNAFDNKKIEEFNKIDKELTDSVNSLTNQINSLEAEKESALSQFDIAYASKLNTQINEIKNDLTEKQNEIIKYNNEIAELEAEYEKNKHEMNSDSMQQDFENTIRISEFVGKYGLPALDIVKNTEKYEAAVNYFDSLSLDDAVNAIKENKQLETQLGTYYQQLLRRYNV